MLQKTLGSGWGVLIPGAVLALLSTLGLSTDVWRGVIVCGLLLSSAMIWLWGGDHFCIGERNASC